MKGQTSIIFIALAVGIFFTVIDPQYKQIKILQEEKMINDQMLQRSAEFKRKYADLMNKYNSISTDERAKLNKVLPETVDNVRLILAMDNIAKNYGIVLRGISVTGGLDPATGSSRVIDRSSKKYGTINVAFSFSAPYQVFKTYMRDLENSLRIVDIKNFSVSATDVGDVYSYSMTLDTYWLR